MRQASKPKLSGQGATSSANDPKEELVKSRDIWLVSGGKIWKAKVEVKSK